MPVEKVSPRTSNLWARQPAASSAAEVSTFGMAFSFPVTRIFKILRRLHKETDTETLGKV